MNNTPFKIVLVDPQIPQNTGNIARLCACTGTELYLVGQLGFQISDKYLKRAGLDYWDEVKIEQFSTLQEVEEKFKESTFYYISTKASNNYTDAPYKPGDLLVFGSETKGLPKDLIETNLENSLRIPMKSEMRSLNLANSAAIVLYEALRHTNYHSFD